MKAPKQSINALEFSRVLAHAARYAKSAPGGESVRGIVPLDGIEQARGRFALVGELRLLQDQDTPLSLEQFSDIGQMVESLAPRGSMLDPAELLAIIPALSNMETVIEALQGKQDELPALTALAEGMAGFPGLLSDLERSIGSEGEILDNASPELKKLRQSLRALDMKISRRLGEITREPEVETFLQDSFVTKRSGRWVIPVRMDSKGMVKGVVHDVSRSGETAFMEPLEIIGLSNELENLSAEGRAEEIRILKRLASLIREAAPALMEEFGVIVKLDMLICISLLAHELGAEAPELTDKGILALHGASHPLLTMIGHHVVPLNMELGGQGGDSGGNIMVITGPNAGGKTIAIKTVGLLCLLASAGIPIPARAESVVPVGESLLVDIGDEQSIEESLSTFTAHARSIGRIVEQAAHGSLVLLDELGTGTDPLQGAALSCGVLNALQERGALVIATTHLTDIVAYVHKTPGMHNSSMEFNPDTHEPLYRLVPGEPGQSHAIEAAERSGMPLEIIEFAREMAGSERLELEEMLRELKEARAGYEGKLAETRKELDAARLERTRLESRMREFEREKKDLLRKELEEARQEGAGIRALMQEMLEEARVTKKPKKAIKKLDLLSREADERIESLKEKDSWTPMAPEEIKPGARVFVRSLGRDAEVAQVDASKKRARVSLGGKEIDVPLEVLSAPKDPAGNEGAKSTGRVTMPERASDNSTGLMEIKLIGLRVEEGLEQLEPVINRASLAGIHSIRIIHGVGTGALRRGVREHLAGHPLVEDFGDAPAEAGAGGVTVAVLR